MINTSIPSAFSSKVRLDIINLLCKRPMTAGEIAAEFKMAWPSISRHLTILKCGNIILCEKRGKNLLYSLNTDFFKEVANWCNGIVNLAENNTTSGGINEK